MIVFSHRRCILYRLTIHRRQRQGPMKLLSLKEEQIHPRVVVPSLLITSSLEKATGSPDEGVNFLNEKYF